MIYLYKRGNQIFSFNTELSKSEFNIFLTGTSGDLVGDYYVGAFQYSRDLDKTVHGFENNLTKSEIENFNLGLLNGVIVEFIEESELISVPDWLNLEQTFYTHPTIFPKALDSVGNGFAFVSKVFADGKTTYAHPNALLMALNLLMPSMNVPYTQEEIDFVNQKLIENNFSIQL